MTSFADYQSAIARIYNPASDPVYQKVWGTGFLVSSQYLLTCAHVVIQALGLKEANFLDVPKETIPIDFPENLELRDSENSNLPKPLAATVEVWQPYERFFQTRLKGIPRGKDIALLRLSSSVPTNPIPLASEPNLKDHNFSVWGFPSSHDQGQVTDGKILAPSFVWLQLRVDENCPVIVGGFSGSPLWDKDLESIVGMTIAASAYDRKEDRGGRDAYAIPAVVLRDVWCKQGQLIELLTPYGQERWIEKAYRQCRASHWTTAQPRNLAETITDLYQMDEEGHQYLVDFVVHILANVPTEDCPETLKESLRQWAESALEVTREEIAQQCDRVTQAAIAPRQDQSLASRLWIVVTEAGTPDCYQIQSAYFIRDIENYERNDRTTYEPLDVKEHQDIPRPNRQRDFLPILSDLLEQVPSERGQLTVEVFLPLKSIGLDPDSWLIEDEYGGDPYPIGTEYSVLIRVYERSGISKPSKKFYEWNTKWNQQQSHQYCRDTLVCSDLSLKDLSKEINKPEKSGLRSICPLKSYPNQPLRLIMQQGVPIALWLRQPLERCQGEELHDEILQTTLAELPQQLRFIRNAEPTNASHLARHVSLLWDDPTKLPPPLSDAAVLRHPRQQP